MEATMPSQVKKLETRDLELVVLSLIVTFICAFSVVAIYFSFTLQPMEKNLLDPLTQRILVVSFFLLITLFSAYIIVKRRELQRMKSTLIEQEIRSRTMNSLLAELIDLYRVSSSVSSDVDLPSVLRIIMETCTGSLKADRAILLTHDPVSDELRIEADAGEKMDWEKLDEAHAKIARSVMESSEPLMINDRATFAQFAQVETDSIAPLSAIYVPLRTESVAIGVLEVIASSEWHFSEHDLKMVSILADHAAISVARNRKTQALEAHVEDLETTNRILMDKNRELQGVTGKVSGSSEGWKPDQS